jgi:Spy/CpxP family protein refolding chaperone
MKLKNILFLLLLFSFALSAAAQERQKRGRFDVDAFIRKKSEYLKKELNLTDAEAKTFIPLEAEFSKKKFEVNRDARRETRELKNKQSKTDADYQRIVQLDLQSEQKESELQIEYFKKFATVLPAEKLEKYRSADIKYKEEALKRHREKYHPGEKFD